MSHPRHSVACFSYLASVMIELNLVFWFMNENLFM